MKHLVQTRVSAAAKAWLENKAAEQHTSVAHYLRNLLEGITQLETQLTAAEGDELVRVVRRATKRGQKRLLRVLQ